MMKKILLGIIGVGVVINAVAEAEYAFNYAGFYLEANAGYAEHPWESDSTTLFGIASHSSQLSGISRSINGGLTMGADMGYQFNRFVSVETGWYHLPKINANFDTAFFGAPLTSSITAGLAYIVLKSAAPVAEHVYLYGKLGTAYTYNRVSARMLSSDSVGSTSRSSFWDVILAAGIQYCFTPSWSANIQYAYAPGYRHASANRLFTPDTQLFTAGIGYKFLM